MNEYIAYQGKKFTVEWYYNPNKKSQALNYYKRLSVVERSKVLGLFKRIGDFAEIKDTSKFNYEGDKIYAFKPVPDRFLCFFFERGRIIVTNAFRKKKQKLPLQEKEKALNYKNDYESRITRGNYYEK